MMHKTLLNDTINRLTTALLVGLFLLQPCQAEPTQHTRVLAASCASCHGTHGNPTISDFSVKHKVLAGMHASDFEKKMLDFKHKKVDSTIMHHHAAGLTHVEIKALARFFANQPIKTNSLPPKATLDTLHD